MKVLVITNTKQGSSEEVVAAEAVAHPRCLEVKTGIQKPSSDRAAHAGEVGGLN